MKTFLASLILVGLIGAAPVIAQDGTITVTAPRPAVAPAALADAQRETRRYVAPADVRDTIHRAKRDGARLVADDYAASGSNIGRPTLRVRRIEFRSDRGPALLLVSQERPAWPFGAEQASYGVVDLPAALDRSVGAGARLLVEPFVADGREVAVVQFADGAIYELHGPQRVRKARWWKARTDRYVPAASERTPIGETSTTGHFDRDAPVKVASVNK